MNEIDVYIEAQPAEAQAALKQLIHTFGQHLPPGFERAMSYGMPAFVVPKSIYPAGYHCKPAEPLPFVSFGAGKTGISVYHMGIYAKPSLLQWFQESWAQTVPTKLDMGKSCIRFKKPDTIPYALMAELATKMTVDEWIALYTFMYKK